MSQVTCAKCKLLVEFCSHDIETTTGVLKNVVGADSNDDYVCENCIDNTTTMMPLKRFMATQAIKGLSGLAIIAQDLLQEAYVADNDSEWNQRVDDWLEGYKLFRKEFSGD